MYNTLNNTKMKVLVFDTETTGLPEDQYASLFDSAKWPHIIQLGYILFDTERKEVIEYINHIVKLAPEVIISPKSIEIHKITAERSQDEGLPIQEVLAAFRKCLQEANLIVAHNLLFDKRMLMVEMNRNKMENFLVRDGRAIPEFCTMKNTTTLCALPKLNTKTGETYFKFPTLSELHLCLFKTEPKGVHNAIVDVIICLRCYVQLKQQYDVALDEEVKAEFRTLFSQYCI